MTQPEPALTVERPAHPGGATADIDTVVVAFPDMQGRLQGKRIHAQFFLDTVLEHGTEGCNYLLAVDVDMNTVDGYAISSWERGYGDMEFVLDLATLHPVPWMPGTAMVLCDLAWLDDDAHRRRREPRGRSCAPRSSARRRRVWSRWPAPSSSSSSSTTPTSRPGPPATADLTPANQYNVDYSLLGTSRVEPLLRDIRNGMFGAGLVVESAKGECNLGQHEIAFKYDEVVRTADKHSIYKNGAKEIACAARQGAHLHGQVRRARGQLLPHPHEPARRRRPASSSTRATGRRRCSSSFVAGIQATMCELTLLYAPNINSYKRFQAGLLRPDVDGVGLRQPHLLAARRRSRCRAAAREPAARRRREPLPRPGRACSRSGLRGIDHELQLEPAFEGNAYTVRQPAACRPRCGTPATCSPAPRWPASCSATRSSTTTSNIADVELAAFDAAVTDWERFRGVREDVSVTADAPRRSSTRRPRQVVATVDAGRRWSRPTRRSSGRTGRSDLAPRRTRRPRPAAAAVRRGRRRRPRGAGAARGAQLRSHDDERALGGRQRPRRPRLLRGRTGTAVRSADPGRRRRRHDVQGAARRRRRHRAVELPDADRRLGLRAGAGRRQHRGAQAGRAHAADGDPARRARPRGRAARRTCSPCCRARARSWASGSSRTPLVRKIVLHRVDRGRARRSWRAPPTR